MKINRLFVKINRLFVKTNRLFMKTNKAFMKFSIVNTDKNNVHHLSVRPVEWLMEHILKDTKAGTIGKLREHIADYGDDGSYEQSTPIARIYPLVELKKTENGNLDIVGFNSLVTLHIGNLLRREDIEAVKEASKRLPMTIAAFMGADGRSVEVMVAVKGDGNGNGNDKGNGNVNGNGNDNVNHNGMSEAEMDVFYKKAYETAISAYIGILPYPVERQMVSCRSNFRMTVDASPYYHPEATPLLVGTGTGTKTGTGTLTGSESEGLTLSLTLSSPDYNLYGVYEQMYRQAAEKAYTETLDVIASQRYNAYITELTRLLCEMGVPEEEAFLHLRNHHIYKETYDEDTFRSIVSAVYAENKPGKLEIGETVSQATRRLIQYLTTRYVFRYNTVMGYTEYRPNNTGMQDWQPCDESVINKMNIEARLDNIDVKDNDVRRYVYSDLIPKSNPISDYLWNVRKAWDGKTDHIAMLARCVPCDVPKWELWFKKWFLSMVAQWVLPEQEYGNSIVPLLISSQGDGKTFFCRNILPKELRWGFLENLDVSEKRTTLQAMHNFLLINLDEFNQISPKLQEGFLKNIIQLPNVKIKRPYGKHVEEFKRYASFIATTNEPSVLSDPSGSRRFICVPLTAPVDTNYKPNYKALYGQAYAMVTDHQMDWWFDADEVKEIMEHNRQFQIMPTAILYFNEYYEPALDEEEGTWMSPTAIYDNLRSIAGSGLKANGVATFGRYLKHTPGIVSRRMGSSRQYLVRKKDSRSAKKASK